MVNEKFINSLTTLLCNVINDVPSMVTGLLQAMATYLVDEDNKKIELPTLANKEASTSIIHLLTRVYLNKFDQDQIHQTKTYSIMLDMSIVFLSYSDLLKIDSTVSSVVGKCFEIFSKKNFALRLTEYIEHENFIYYISKNIVDLYLLKNKGRPIIQTLFKENLEKIIKEKENISKAIK